MSGNEHRAHKRCSFCGRGQRQVKTLIAGENDENALICNLCIALCKDIVSNTATEPSEPTLSDMRPSTIRAYLDEHIIGQPRAKVGLSVAVYNHFKRLRDHEEEPSADLEDRTELSKGNILMIGPTGTGKTLIARTLAKKLGVPFTIADATTLTEAGYVGEDVESIVKNLWLAADKDPVLAGQGIVCIDEVDKIARGGASAGTVRDVGGEGVQQALLKIVEGQSVSFQPDGARGRSQSEAVEIDTTNILFICCGAFVGLEDIIQRRLTHAPIGFGSEAERKQLSRSELLQHVRAEDLVQFGLIPEFVGRIPVVVSLDDLTEDDLIEILWRPKNSLIKQYQRLLDLQGVELRFDDGALKAIVEQAMERKSGARGLRAIVESVMLHVMYELPSMEGIAQCVITEESVREGAPPILLPQTGDAA